MRIKLIYTFLLCLLIFNVYSQNIPTCTLIPIEGSDKIPDEIKSAFTRELFSIINSTHLYRLTSLQQTEYIYKQLSFKTEYPLSYRAFAIGNFLKSDYVIFGRIEQDYFYYILTTYLIDIKNVKIINGIQTKGNKTSRDIIQLMAKSNIQALLNIEKTAFPPEEAPRGTTYDKLRLHPIETLFVPSILLHYKKQCYRDFLENDGLQTIEAFKHYRINSDAFILEAGIKLLNTLYTGLLLAEKNILLHNSEGATYKFPFSDMYGVSFEYSILPANGFNISVGFDYLKGDFQNPSIKYTYQHEDFIPWDKLKLDYTEKIYKIYGSKIINPATSIHAGISYSTVTIKEKGLYNSEEYLGILKEKDNIGIETGIKYFFSKNLFVGFEACLLREETLMFNLGWLFR